MSLPPKDVPASELFLKLMETPRPTEVIDFPRKDAQGDPIGKIRIQTLRMDQHDQARAEAHAKMKARGFTNDDMGSPGIREVFGDAVAKEVIAMACLDVGVDGKPESYGRIFSDGSQISKALGPDEVLVLFTAIQLVQHKYGPLEKMDPDHVEAWIKRLVEGGSAFPLLQLPLPDLVELTSLLAARIYSLCGALASQLSNLPPTLVAQLESLITDIGSFGTPAAEPENLGGESKPDVTLQDAVRHASTFKG